MGLSFSVPLQGNPATPFLGDPASWVAGPLASQRLSGSNPVPSIECRAPTSKQVKQPKREPGQAIRYPFLDSKASVSGLFKRNSNQIATTKRTAIVTRTTLSTLSAKGTQSWPRQINNKAVATFGLQTS